MEEREINLDELSQDQLVGLKRLLIYLLDYEKISSSLKANIELILECVNQRIKTENINDNVKISKNDIVNATSYMKNISSIPDNVLNEIQDNIIAEQNEHVGIAIRLEALALPIVVLFAVGSLVVEGVTSLWKQGIIQIGLGVIGAGGLTFVLVKTGVISKLIEKIKESKNIKKEEEKQLVKTKEVEKEKEVEIENTKSESTRKENLNEDYRKFTKYGYDRVLKLYESSTGVWYMISLNMIDNKVVITSNSDFIEKETKEAYDYLCNLFKLEKSDNFGVQLQTLKNFRVLVPGSKDIIKKLEIAKDYFTVTKTNDEETFFLSDFESQPEYSEALDDIISEIKDTYAPISYSNIINSGIIQDKTYKKSLTEKVSDASLKSKIGIKNLWTNHKKLISVIGATTVITASTYGAYKLGQNNKTPKLDDTIDNIPDNYFEDSYQEDVTNSDFYTTIEPDYEQPLPNPDEVNSMEVMDNQDNILPVETPSDMEVFINENKDYATDIANNLHNEENERPTDRKLSHYEEYVTNPFEKAYVQYFSNISNELTQNYYDKVAQERLDANIIDANKEVVRCVLEDESVVCPVDGDYYDISFSELSPYSQELVLQVAQNIYLLLLDKTFEYNGITYDNDAVASLLSDKMYELNNSTLDTSIGQAYVKYFFDIANNITKNNLMSKEELDAYIQDANREIIRCLDNDEVVLCMVDDNYYEVRFSDLSDKNKKLALREMIKINEELTTTIEYEGNYYTKEYISSLLKLQKNKVKTK